jgi:hypothetical protein
MPLSDLITSDFLDLYTEGEDTMYSGLAIACELIYPPVRTECPNCELDPVSMKSANIYKVGGPISFSGGVCPFCNGIGFNESNNTESINLQVNWNAQTFVQPYRQRALVNQGKTMIQVKGRLVDLPKFMQAIELIVNKALEGYIRYKFSISGEPIPSGLRQNKYFYALLERVG